MELNASNVLDCLNKIIDPRIMCKTWAKGDFERVYCKTYNSKGRPYGFHIQAKPEFKIDMGNAAYFRDQRGVSRFTIEKGLKSCGIDVPENG